MCRPPPPKHGGQCLRREVRLLLLLRAPPQPPRTPGAVHACMRRGCDRPGKFEAAPWLSVAFPVWYVPLCSRTHARTHSSWEAGLALQLGIDVRRILRRGLLSPAAGLVRFVCVCVWGGLLVFFFPLPFARIKRGGLGGWSRSRCQRCPASRLQSGLRACGSQRIFTCRIK